MREKIWKFMIVYAFLQAVWIEIQTFGALIEANWWETLLEHFMMASDILTSRKNKH